MKKNLFLYALLLVLSGAAFGITASTLCFIASGTLIAFMVARKKNVYVLVSSILALILCFTVSGISKTVCFLLGGILPGVLLGIGYTKKLSLPYLTALPSLGFVSLWMYLFYSYKAQTGTNVFTDMGKMISETALQSAEELLKNSNVPLTEDVTAELTTSISSAVNTISLLSPAIIIVFAAGFTFLLVMLSKKVVPGAAAYLTPFSRLRVPGMMLFVSFLCMVGFSSAEGGIKYVFANVFAVLISYTLLAGFSVLDFFVKRKIKSSLSRIIIYMLIFFIGNILFYGTLTFPLILIGTFDALFDFRKLRYHPNRD